MFNMTRALSDEEYARRISIDKKDEIHYDDYIFVLSTIIASNINLEHWCDALNREENRFESLVRYAAVDHCLDWNEAVKSSISHYNLNIYDNGQYRTTMESRRIVENKITPILLKKLEYNGTISNNDILFALRNINI